MTGCFVSPHCEGVPNKRWQGFTEFALLSFYLNFCLCIETSSRISFVLTAYSSVKAEFKQIKLL